MRLSIGGDAPFGQDRPLARSSTIHMRKSIPDLAKFQEEDQTGSPKQSRLRRNNSNPFLFDNSSDEEARLAHNQIAEQEFEESPIKQGRNLSPLQFKLGPAALEEPKQSKFARTGPFKKETGEPEYHDSSDGSYRRIRSADVDDDVKLRYKYKNHETGEVNYTSSLLDPEEGRSYTESRDDDAFNSSQQNGSQLSHPSSQMLEDIEGNYGRQYFCGLMRMTHLRFVQFIMCMEILQLLNTIGHSLLIYLQREKYSLRSEDYMADF